MAFITPPIVQPNTLSEVYYTKAEVLDLIRDGVGSSTNSSGSSSNGNIVTITGSGNTTSDGTGKTYIATLGSTYTYTISNFNLSTDKISFGSNVTASMVDIVNTTADGMVSFNYSPDLGATVTTIKLIGLSSNDDLKLTTTEGLSSILI